MFGNTNTTDGTHRLKSILLAALVGLTVLSSFAVAPAAAAGDVTITVEDDTAAAIEGATVTLYDSADDTEVANATTDANGDVTLSSVADATYYAEVSADGYADASASSITVSGSAVTQTVTMSEEPDKLVNETVALDPNTLTVWGEATAEAIGSGNSTDVTVTFVGVNESEGTETQLKNETMTLSGEEVGYSDVTISDSHRSNYSDVRIVIEGHSEDINATDYGTTVSVAGGGGSSGGSLPLGSIWGIPVLGIIGLALVGGYWYMEIN